MSSPSATSRVAVAGSTVPTSLLCRICSAPVLPCRIRAPDRFIVVVVRAEMQFIGEEVETRSRASVEARLRGRMPRGARRVGQRLRGEAPRRRRYQDAVECGSNAQESHHGKRERRRRAGASRAREKKGKIIAEVDELGYIEALDTDGTGDDFEEDDINIDEIYIKGDEKRTRGPAFALRRRYISPNSDQHPLYDVGVQLCSDEDDGAEVYICCTKKEEEETRTACSCKSMFRRALKSYHIVQNRNYWYLRNDPDRVKEIYMILKPNT
ncbi:hypothetical protein OsI_00518 [Oryza sativa Indica Group]|uniref:Uncharacterized protein n=1 Tax=Oryza sativa subsp. indica TaxID=39946 RepID=B8ADE8_ORYSI|nr:hypothetical protein OsI_00518 [Oryza sativa Indica Group]